MCRGSEIEHVAPSERPDYLAHSPILHWVTLPLPCTEHIIQSRQKQNYRSEYGKASLYISILLLRFGPRMHFDMIYSIFRRPLILHSLFCVSLRRTEECSVKAHLLYSYLGCGIVGHPLYGLTQFSETAVGAGAS